MHKIKFQLHSHFISMIKNATFNYPTFLGIRLSRALIESDNRGSTVFKIFSSGMSTLLIFYDLINEDIFLYFHLEKFLLVCQDDFVYTEKRKKLHKLCFALTRSTIIGE